MENQLFRLFRFTWWSRLCSGGNSCRFSSSSSIIASDVNVFQMVTVMWTPRTVIASIQIRKTCIGTSHIVQPDSSSPWWVYGVKDVSNIPSIVSAIKRSMRSQNPRILGWGQPMTFYPSLFMHTFLFTYYGDLWRKCDLSMLTRFINVTKPVACRTLRIEHILHLSKHLKPKAYRFLRHPWPCDHRICPCTLLGVSAQTPVISSLIGTPRTCNCFPQSSTVAVYSI